MFFLLAAVAAGAVVIIRPQLPAASAILRLAAEPIHLLVEAVEVVLRRTQH
ncbi:hypothetical protein GCM10027343_31120 [Noviherbaspirillum agri]